MTISSNGGSLSRRTSSSHSSGPGESNPVGVGSAGTAKPSENEVKSHEILLGNNLNDQGTGSISHNSHKFSTLQRVSTSSGSGGVGVRSGADQENNKLSIRKEKIKSNPEKWHFSTLPRKSLIGSSIISEENSSFSPEDQEESGETEANVKVPKSKSVATDLVAVVLPPPPSFKSVHFAPNVNEDDTDSVPCIPTEGLPSGPANAKDKKDSSKCVEKERVMRSGAGPKTGPTPSSKVPCFNEKGNRTGYQPSAGDTGITSASASLCDFVIPKSEIVPIKVKK